MNYKSIYDALISKRKRCPAVGITEIHHIIPRCLGGSDEADNLVILTCREHLIAHKLLPRFSSETGPLLHALRMMLLTRTTSRGYEANKIQLKVLQLSPEYRKHLSDKMQRPEVKKRKSDSAKQAWQDPVKRDAFLKNRILTDEILARRSDGQKRAWQNDERKSSLAARNANLPEDVRASKRRSMIEFWKNNNHPTKGKKWYNDGKKSFLMHPEEAATLGLHQGRLSSRVMPPDKQ